MKFNYIVMVDSKLRWTINYLYFWYSLLYLIGRTLFLFMCAAQINDESQGPLYRLRMVPSSLMCPEVMLLYVILKKVINLFNK